jgi:hypothetical protein
MLVIKLIIILGIKLIIKLLLCLRIGKLRVLRVINLTLNQALITKG